MHAGCWTALHAASDSGAQTIEDETIPVPVVVGLTGVSTPSFGASIFPQTPAVAYLELSGGTPGQATVTVYHYHVVVTAGSSEITNGSPGTATIPFATIVPIG
jgi:hypothetical protein